MLQLLLFNVTNGLIIGAFYVLMALGLSLILNLSNVINFAHGGFLVVGGYIAYTITPYVGFWGALLIAPPITAVIGLATERVLIRPLYGRDPLYSLLSLLVLLSSWKTARALFGARRASRSPCRQFWRS